VADDPSEVKQRISPPVSTMNNRGSTCVAGTAASFGVVPSAPTKTAGCSDGVSAVRLAPGVSGVAKSRVGPASGVA
jgi:hypothetical protein